MLLKYIQMCHKNQTKRHYQILLNVRMFRLMVFNATFNNISWRKPLTCHKSLTNLITLCCIEYTSQWTGFELTTLVVIGTGSCKSIHHIIIAKNAPIKCICTSRSTKHRALRSKIKVCLAWIQYNVFEWKDMSNYRLLFQWGSTIKM